MIPVIFSLCHHPMNVHDLSFSLVWITINMLILFRSMFWGCFWLPFLLKFDSFHAKDFYVGRLMLVSGDDQNAYFRSSDALSHCALRNNRDLNWRDLFRALLILALKRRYLAQNNCNVVLRCCFTTGRMAWLTTVPPFCRGKHRLNKQPELNSMMLVSLHHCYLSPGTILCENEHDLFLSLLKLKIFL
jgi:hypothetical protein